MSVAARRAARCYGSMRPRPLSTTPQMNSAVDALVANALETETHFISAEKLTWADVANDYAEAVDSPPDSPPPASRPLQQTPSSVPQNAVQVAEEERRRFAAEKEKTILAAMARRRKVAKRNSKTAKIERETDALLHVAREWAHIERGREGEGKATILLAPPEKLAAKRKRVSESADATARDACLRALAEGADAAAPDATGAAALLYLASINAPEAHEVMRKVIHDGTDLSVAHALDGKGPLDVALEAGNVWAVRALLSRGAAPLCAPSLTEGCCSLLEFATLHGFVRQAALALTQLLFSALDAADPVVLAAVLSHGVSPNVRDSSGRTPLLRCIQEGLSFKCAEELLCRGANPNIYDPCGMPAAMFAIVRRDRAMLAALARHGLDPTAREGLADETLREAAACHGWSAAELAEMFTIAASPRSSPATTGQSSPATPADGHAADTPPAGNGNASRSEASP